jgi:glycine cleavage system H lipoate-binding protein
MISAVSMYKNGGAIHRVLRRQLFPRLLSTVNAGAMIVDGDCAYSRSVQSQRVMYTIGVTKECHSRLNINFVDIVPVGTRLQGGIRPSVFAYVEGENGKTQLSMPEEIDYGEVIAINANVTENPDRSVMPTGYLVHIDAGEADDEDAI